MLKLRLRLLYFAVWCFAIAAAPQATTLAAKPKSSATPQWIWITKTAKPQEIVIFRKAFEIAGEVKSASLVVACDNHVTLFVNGQQTLQHDTWEQPVKEDVTKRLKPGLNIIATRCRNDSGPAALMLNLTVETADGGRQTVVTDTSWLAAKDPPENWREAKYDDSGWSKAVSLAKLGGGPWAQAGAGAKGSTGATTSDAITALEGFEVELLYSVPKSEQGSWVSMTPDPQGRLIVCDQYGGLYRVTPGKDAETTKVEKLAAPIGESQGMLWAYDSLYLTVNGGAAQGSGFYRLRDTNGDDQFDEIKLLKKLNGGGEHGPHAVRLGPDGLLYIIAGNHTNIPDRTGG